MSCWRLTGAGLAGLLAAQAIASPSPDSDPAENLIKAAEASRSQTYEGVLIYRQGDDHLDVLKVQHRFADGSERESLTSMNGEARQVIRIDNRVILVLPKGQSLNMERPSLKGVLSQLTRERIEQLAQWYDFRDEGSSRIADRPSEGVLIAPRDHLRFGYEVWYDRETFVPLKLSIVGEHGEVLEQGMITQISYPKSIPDNVFETEVDTSKFNLVTSVVPSLAKTADTGAPQVTFEELPPGFKVVAREETPLPEGQDGQAEHLLLSDGLASVSVFSTIRKTNKGSSFRGISHTGPMQAYGRTEGDYHITIVGEVPTATIRLIGDGTRPVLMPEAMPGTPPPPASGVAAPTPQ